MQNTASLPFRPFDRDPRQAIQSGKRLPVANATWALPPRARGFPFLNSLGRSVPGRWPTRVAVGGALPGCQKRSGAQCGLIET